MSHIEKPITKEMAAEILSVSLRTVDNWIANKTLPMPTSIGRRVYWHPTDFKQWLNGRFGQRPQQEASGNPEPRQRGRPRTRIQ